MLRYAVQLFTEYENWQCYSEPSDDYATAEEAEMAIRASKNGCDAALILASGDPWPKVHSEWSKMNPEGVWKREP